MKKTLLIAFALFFLASLYSCKKEKDENPNLFANEQLILVMDDWYLWYEMVPDANPEKYPSPVELMDALRYKELDRWSYVTTKQEIEAYYQAGEYIGFGFGSAFDSDNQLWITFTYNDSPLREFGVNRSWRISTIDGVAPTPENARNLFGPAEAGLTRTFSFLSPNNETITATAAKRAITINSVLLDTVYTAANSKIGYVVLQNFIGPTKDELDEVFSDFLLQGVTQLIVDLRYNGGGMVQTANHLANLIAGQFANNQILGKYVHNDKHSHRNDSLTIKQVTNSLPLERVAYITTQNSASASELVINGLFPHMPVTLVGKRTYGKPVGAYVLVSDDFDWAFVPICFKILNANNEGDYYDGIPVDIEQIDGINFAFGDLNEPSLNSAFSYLEGTSPKYLPSNYKKIIYPNHKGLQAEIGAW